MMAQRIQTICDTHLERGEDVDATTWEVLVRRAGQRTQMRLLDLCDDCARTLETVAALAAEMGRMATDDAPVATNGTSKRPRVPCPMPGCESRLSQGNLARHVESVHQLTLAEVEAAAGVPGGHQCPDCERSFTRPQGLGAHRYQAHGYESPSRAARLEREAAAS